jgi:hypothetical protein
MKVRPLALLKWMFLIYSIDMLESRIINFVTINSRAFSSSVQEMMQHMVMKHGSQFDSYFEHITYPLTLYSGVCSGAACATAGRYAAYSAALAKVQHRGTASMTGLREYMCKK